MQTKVRAKLVMTAPYRNARKAEYLLFQRLLAIVTLVANVLYRKTNSVCLI